MIAEKYPSIRDSPLAEQKNARLQKFETQAAYMKQMAFLLYVRYFLHRLNQLENMAAEGLILWSNLRSQFEL